MVDRSRCRQDCQRADNLSIVAAANAQAKAAAAIAVAEAEQSGEVVCTGEKGPKNGAVVVTLPQAGTAVIEVYNSAGGLMQRLSTTSTVNTLSVAGWAAGVYTVRVVQGGLATSSSFIKVN